MDGGRCFIVGAGEYSGSEMPVKGDYVIAADGGYAELVSRGIVPDMVIGDFDSLGGTPAHNNVIVSPAEKDDTDMMLAVREGLVRGNNIFVIDGGLGGRLDHTLANIQILAYIAQNGARGYLLGNGICVTAVTNGTVGFKSGLSGGISIFCMDGRAAGVTISGLKYAIDNAELSNAYPIGVSNEFSGTPASVTVRAGTLVIIWTGGLWGVEGT